MSIPIFDNKKNVVAFFEVYNKKAGAEFTPQDLKNSLAAAQIASLAIQNGLIHRRLVALSAFSQSLTLASDLDQILEVVAQHLELNFHRGSVVLLPSNEGLTLRFQTPEFISTAKELEAAAWCWEHGQEAGASTTTLPDAQAYYLVWPGNSNSIAIRLPNDNSSSTCHRAFDDDKRILWLVGLS
jgi:K+-sensing histidine kinase KdpD